MGRLRYFSVFFFFLASAQAQTCPEIQVNGTDKTLVIANDLRVSLIQDSITLERTIFAEIRDRFTGQMNFLQRTTTPSLPRGDVYAYRLRGNKYQEFIKSAVLKVGSQTLWLVASTNHPDVDPFLMVDFSEWDGSGVLCLPAALIPGLVFGDFASAWFQEIETAGDVMALTTPLQKLAILPRHLKTRQYSSADLSGGNSRDGFDNSTYVRQNTPNDFVLLDEPGPAHLTQMFFNPNLPSMLPAYFSHGLNFTSGGALIATGLAYQFFDGSHPLFQPPFVGLGHGGYWSTEPIFFKNGIQVNGAAATFHHFVTTTGAGPSDFKNIQSIYSNSNINPSATPPIVQTLTLPPHSSTTVVYIQNPGAIFRFKVAPLSTGSLATPQDFWKKLRIQWRFDQHSTLDVDTELGTFFGASSQSHSVQSVGWTLNSAEGVSRFTMPFDYSAECVLNNSSNTSVTVLIEYEWTAGQYPRPFGYFSTTSTQGFSQTGVDYIEAERTGTGKWVAEIIEPRIATPQINSNYNLFEGDPRVFVDGETDPSHHGTSHEAIANWGWYGVAGFDEPFMHPTHGYSGGLVVTDRGYPELLRSFFRQRLYFDPVYYYENFRAQLEHGPINDQNADYRATSFFYAIESVTSQMTDQILPNTVPPQAGTHISSETSTFANDRSAGAETVSFISGNQPFQFGARILPQNEGVTLRFLLHRFSDGEYSGRVFVEDHEVGVIHQPYQNRAGGNQWTAFFEREINIPAAISRGKSSINIRVEPINGFWKQGRVRAYSKLSF